MVAVPVGEGRFNPPNTAIVFIEATYDERPGIVVTGSGVIVGRNDVLTAGHVIFDNVLGFADHVTITISYDPTGPTGPSYSAVTIEGFTNFDPDGDGLIAPYVANGLGGAEVDFGLLSFAVPIAEEHGMMWLDGTIYDRYYLSGYPSAYNKRLTSENLPVSLYPGETSFDINAFDVSPGISGGPLWAYDGYFGQLAGVLSTTGAAGWVGGVWNDLVAAITNNDLDLGEGVKGVFLMGNSGNNTMTGSAGGDQISGAGGNDTLSGLAGNDIIYGGEGAGNDTIDGGAGDDILLGGDGNDIIITGAGADRAFGGAGNDIFNLGADTLDIIDDRSGIDTVQSTVTRSIGAHTFIENLSLYGTAKISGVGNYLANVLNGSGNTAANNLAGLTGNDTYILGIGDRALENANGGIDTAKSSLIGINLTYQQNVENAELSGTLAVNLTGNDLNNRLTGNSAVNTLNGGNGNDTLISGYGNDQLVGGAGNDTYVFNSALSSTANRDRINDYVISADTIQLENAIFTMLAAAGQLSSFFFRSGSAALDANDYIIHNRATGALFYDADGNGAGAAIQFATVAVNLPLVYSEFIVI